MLSFHKTALHQFTPSRHPDVGGQSFHLYTPHQIYLLPGRKTTVDFLLAVDLPQGYRGDLRLRSSEHRKLVVRAQPLCKWSRKDASKKI